MCLVQFLANIIIIIIIIRFEDDMARYVCLTVTFLPCGLYKREGFVYLFLRMSTEHNTLITVFFFFSFKDQAATPHLPSHNVCCQSYLGSVT